MRRFYAYISVLLVVALFALLPSFVTSPFDRGYQETLLSIDNTQGKRDVSHHDDLLKVSCCKDQTFSLIDNEPFVKQETTDKVNKLPSVIRFAYRKVAVTHYDDEITVPYRIIAQYRLKHFTILRSNDYYLYSLCRIII
ncbi:MAG: hypothetical protein PUB21_10410 [Bacteroidales bacterium]|nr:hypothetical protein [Bacteroidales bacterium]